MQVTGDVQWDDPGSEHTIVQMFTTHDSICIKWLSSGTNLPHTAIVGNKHLMRLLHLCADVPYETASGTQYWMGEDGERMYQDLQACSMPSNVAW